MATLSANIEIRAIGYGLSNHNLLTANVNIDGIDGIFGAANSFSANFVVEWHKTIRSDTRACAKNW